MNIQATLQMITVAVIPLLFAITMHEAAHGWVAAKLGDKTALMLGRVTLNPVPHIDPLGTLILPALMLMVSNFIFGWAKPVPITKANLKNPRLDMALVAIAGPSANFIMALAWAIIAKLATVFYPGSQGLVRSTLVYLFAAGNYGIMINGVLMVLNLLPIPPLDGSRVISSAIPRRWSYYYDMLEPYGLWILLVLLALGFLSQIIQGPLMAFIKWIHGLFSLTMLNN